MNGDPSPDARYMRWRQAATSVWTVIGVIVLLMGAYWLLVQVWPAVVPILIGAVVAFLLRWPVNKMADSGVNRTFAATIAYAGGLVTVVLASIFLIPPLAERFREFAAAFPDYYRQAYDVWLDMQARYAGVSLPGWAADLADQVQETITTQMGSWSAQAASGVIAAGGEAVSFVFNLVIGLVVGFYLLKGLPRLKQSAVLLVPEGHRDDVAEMGSRISCAVGGFIRGQLIIAAIVGVLTTIGLAVIGLPYPIVIGFITGLFNVVPYFGPIVGGSIAAIVGLFVDPWLALLAIAVVVAVQQVESLILSPKIMSDQVDLHPVVVIFSLLVGGTLLGFFGLLFAIPIAATVKAVAGFYLEKHGWIPVKPETTTRRGRRFAWLAPSETDEDASDGPAAEEEPTS
jgi:predicted PurR-regulated permease PerM